MLHSTNPAFEKKNCRRPSNQLILEMKEHVQSCEFQKGVLHKLWTYRLSLKATASIIPPAVLLFYLYGEAFLACGELLRRQSCRSCRAPLGLLLTPLRPRRQWPLREYLTGKFSRSKIPSRAGELISLIGFFRLVTAWRNGSNNLISSSFR